MTIPSLSLVTRTASGYARNDFENISFAASSRAAYSVSFFDRRRKFQTATDETTHKSAIRMMTVISMTPLAGFLLERVPVSLSFGFYRTEPRQVPLISLRQSLSCRSSAPVLLKSVDLGGASRIIEGE